MRGWMPSAWPAPTFAGLGELMVSILPRFVGNINSPLVDNTDVDTSLRQSHRTHQPRWASTNNQDIDFALLGEGTRHVVGSLEGEHLNVECSSDPFYISCEVSHARCDDEKICLERVNRICDTEARDGMLQILPYASQGSKCQYQ